MIREIASLFGCPPFVAGGTSDTRYNNITARMSVLHRETVTPLLDNITAKLSQALETEIVYDQYALVRGDLASQSEIGVKMAGGPYKSVNEVREMFGDEKHEGEENDAIRNTNSTSEEEPEEGDDDRTGEFPTDDGNLGTQPPEG